MYLDGKLTPLLLLADEYQDEVRYLKERAA
jgi:hypothetical protein